MNAFVKAVFFDGISSGFEGFFKFCKDKKGYDFDELNGLFKEYFEIEEDLVLKNKSPNKQSKKANKENFNEDLPKAVDGITSLKLCNIENETWCKKIPLSEFKKYSKERKLAVSGTKAQLISNLIKYEKEKASFEEKPTMVLNIEPTVQTDDSDIDVEESKTAHPSITVKKPKRCGKKQKCAKDKLAEPESREMVYRNGYWMIKVPNDDKYLIMDSEEDDALVIGYVKEDDIDGPDVDVDVRPLTKKTIQIAQKLQLLYDIPDNLDNLNV